MELKLHYDTGNYIVVADAVGSLTTDNIREAAGRSRKFSEEHDCYNLLVDITKCSISRSMLEAFIDMQHFMELTGLSIQYKCAVLFDPTHYPEDRAKFIETVVTNRPNPRFRMFLNRTEAIDWLHE